MSESQANEDRRADDTEEEEEETEEEEEEAGEKHNVEEEEEDEDEDEDEAKQHQQLTKRTNKLNMDENEGNKQHAIGTQNTLSGYKPFSVVSAGGSSRRMSSSSSSTRGNIADGESLMTWDRDGSVRLRLADKGPGSEKPITVIQMLENTVKAAPERVALVRKTDNKWTGYTYSWYHDQICCAARAFIQLGLEPLHGVAILGFNSVEWFISEMAAIMAGGIASGIYTTNSADACKYVIDNVECQIVVVENAQQVNKILTVVDSLPSVKAIVQYQGEPTDSRVISWSDLMDLGDQGNKEHENERQKRVDSLAPDKCCMILHTSGTTGNPKGVMLSHDNMTWTANSVSKLVGLKFAEEIFVSYLPLSHAAAQMLDIMGATCCGATVYFAQPDALKGSLGQTLKEARPTRFLGVPRVWEKMQEGIEAATAKHAKGAKRLIVNWARRLSVRSHMAAMRGEPKYLGFSMGRKLVYSKVRHQLGFDRCRAFYSGAAPISRKTIDFFMSLDMPISEVYGMTESSGPHTLNMPKNGTVGSVGRDMPGVKTKFALAEMSGEYEICMGGRHVFMGYVNMMEQTKSTLDSDGWLHSGDLGFKDSKEFLFISGRLKELIITAGGENIPPVIIEEQVKEALPCISNCMLIGDRRKFLSMLLTMKTVVNTETGEPDNALTETAKEWCQSVGSNSTTLTDILETQDQQVLQAVQRGIDAVNKRATSQAQRIQKWTLLPQDFSVFGGELGPTLKLKRYFVENIYSDTIEEFYGADEGNNNYVK